MSLSGFANRLIGDAGAGGKDAFNALGDPANYQNMIPSLEPGDKAAAESDLTVQTDQTGTDRQEPAQTDPVYLEAVKKRDELVTELSGVYDGVKAGSIAPADFPGLVDRLKGKINWLDDMIRNYQPENESDTGPEYQPVAQTMPDDAENGDFEPEIADNPGIESDINDGFSPEVETGIDPETHNHASVPVRWLNNPVDGAVASGNTGTGKSVDIIESDAGFTVSVSNDKGQNYAAAPVADLAAAKKLAGELTGRSDLFADTGKMAENDPAQNAPKLTKSDFFGNSSGGLATNAKSGQTAKWKRIKGGILWSAPDESGQVQYWFEPAGRAGLKKAGKKLRAVSFRRGDGLPDVTKKVIPASAAQAMQMSDSGQVAAAGGVYAAGRDAENRALDKRSDADLAGLLAGHSGRDVQVADPAVDPDSKALDRLGRLLGVRIVRVSGLGADGCHDPAIPGVLFIDVDSVQPELFVFGHELFHELRQVASYNPVIGSELKALAVAAKAAGVDMGNTAATGSEALADLLGSALTKPAFWQALYKQNTRLYDKVVNFFKKLISRLKLQVADGRDVFAGVKDPGDMADRLAKLLNLWKNQAGSIANRRVDGEVKFSGEFQYDLSNWQYQFDNLKPGGSITLPHSPAALQVAGAKNLPLVMFGSKITKIYQDHPAISPDILRDLPKYLANPIAIFESVHDKENPQNKALVVWTEIDAENGDPVIVAIHLNVYHDRYVINKLASAYDRANPADTFHKWLDNGLLRYFKTKKSLQQYMTDRLQLPEVSGIVERSTVNVPDITDAVKLMQNNNLSYSGDKSDNADRDIKLGINYKPENDWKDRLFAKYYSFRKKFSDSNILLKDIFGIDAGELNPSDNPYSLAVAFSMKSGARAMQAIFHGTRSLFGNKATGESLAAILKPLVDKGQVDAFGRYLVALRAVNLAGRKVSSGFDIDAANELIASAPAAWQDLAQRVTGWSNRMLDLLVEGGAITGAEAEIIKAANPIYVPFYRLDKARGIRPGKSAGKGYTNYGNPVKRIGDADGVIIDPVESLMIMAEVYISRAQKAAIARAVANLAIRGDNGMSGLVERLEQAPKYDPAERKNQASAKLKKEAYAGLDLENADPFLDLFEVTGKQGGGNGRYTISTIVNGKRQWF